jgi:hypothetical protein
MNCRNWQRLREFEEIESQGKAVATVNSMEENSQDFCLDFVQEFGLSLKTPFYLNPYFWASLILYYLFYFKFTPAFTR